MRARQHALPPVPGLPGLPDFAAVGSVSLEKKHKPARGPTVCNVHNSIAHKPLRTKSLKKSFYGTTFALIAHRPVLALLDTAKGAGREEAGIAQGNSRHGGLSLNREPSAPEQHCVLEVNGRHACNASGLSPNDPGSGALTGPASSSLTRDCFLR